MSSVMDRLGGAWRGDSLEHLSSQLHESQSATRKGLETAVPFSMAGLASQFSSEQKAGELLGALRGNSLPQLDVAQLGSVVQDPSTMGKLAQAGKEMLERVFGSKFDTAIETFAGQHGVSRSSASTLLGLAAPLVIGAIQKETLSRNLDAQGLSRYLTEEGRKASGLVPRKLSALLGREEPLDAQMGRVSYADRALETHSYDTPMYPSGGEGHGNAPPPRVAAPARSYPPMAKSRSGGLWWVALALGVLVLFAVVRRTNDTERAGQTSGTKTQTIEPRADDESQRRTTEIAPAPPLEGKEDRQGGGSIEAVTADKQRMQDEAGPAHRVEDTRTQAPQAAAPVERKPAEKEGAAGQMGPQVYSVLFATGSTRPHDRAELARAVDTSKQHESARVLLQGYTDQRGDEEQNQKLSEARVASVKSYLMRHGVAAERIETAALGISNPRSSSSESRRVEITIKPQ